MADEGHATEEGRLQATWQNRAAGRALRSARVSMSDGGSKQAAFASRLSRGLGISISVAALSNWENGRRTVPMAVLVEAATTSGKSIDSLLGESGEPVISEWVAELELPRRVATLERRVQEFAGLSDEVAELKEVVKGGRASGGVGEEPVGSVAEPENRPPATLEFLTEQISELESEVTDLGGRLQRPWEQEDEANRATPADVTSDLRRRMERLQIRVNDLRSALGLSLPGYPSEPETSASREVVIGWLAQMVGRLRGQLRNVLAHPSLADQPPGDSRADVEQTESQG